MRCSIINERKLNKIMRDLSTSERNYTENIKNDTENDIVLKL